MNKIKEHMAIFHLHIKSLGRSNNNNIVAASAYRSGSTLSQYSVSSKGIDCIKTHNYSNKDGVVFSKIFVPKNSSIWMGDREALWNLIQNKFDIRKNAVYAQEVVVALPIELDIFANKNLTEDFVENILVQEGMICDVNMHMDNPENPHLHILMTTREIIPDDKGDFTFGKKVRYWDSRNFLINLRKDWALYVNKHLEMHGLDIRISPLSNKDRNINFAPSVKEGMGSAFHIKTRKALNNKIREQNKKHIVQNPYIILDILRASKALFTKEDIERELGKYFTGEELCSGSHLKNIESILSHPRIVYSGMRDAKGRMLFKDSTRVSLEEDFIQIIDNLKTEFSEHNLALSQTDISEITQPTISNLTKAQLKAVRQLVNSGNIAVLEGLAGSGKTTILREVVKIYKHFGKKVIATAVSNNAANELGKVIKAESLNVTKLRYDISKQSNANFKLNLPADYFKHQDLITKSKMIDENTIIIIDEASMVNLVDLHYFVSLISAKGAKLILVGDRKQLSAINIAGSFDKICNVFEPCTLSSSKRQIKTLHRKATRLLSDFKIEESLRIYLKCNNFHFTEDHYSALEKIAKDFTNKYLSVDNKEAIVALAFRNIDVAQINNLVRTNLKEVGFIGRKEVKFQFLHNDIVDVRNFSNNDRVVFCKNDKKLGIYNKDQGIILSISHLKTLGLYKVRVKLDRKLPLGRYNIPIIVDVYNHEYKALDHLYALNVTKSQGLTFDHTFCLIDQHMGYNAFLVGATRHRYNVSFYVSNMLLKIVEEQQDMPPTKNIDNIRLSRLLPIISQKQPRSFVSDLLAPDEIAKYNIVDEYFTLSIEARNLASLIYKRGSENQKHELRSEFQDIIQGRNRFAKTIMDNYESYENILHNTKADLNLLKKHSGRQNFTLFKPIISQAKSKKIDFLKVIIEDIQIFEKHIQGPLFDKYNEGEVKKHIKKLLDKSKEILSYNDDTINALEEMRLDREKHLNYRKDLNSILENAIKYNNSTIFQFLANTYKEDPIDIINHWEDSLENENVKLGSKGFKKNRFSLIGRGLGKYLAFDNDRSRSIENTTILEEKFKHYEENKKQIPEIQKKIKALESDNKIHELSLGIRHLEKSVIDKKISDILREIICELESNKPSTEKLSWIKSSPNIKNIQTIYNNNFKNQQIQNLNYKERGWKSGENNKTFSRQEIENIFRKYIKMLKPDSDIQIKKDSIISGSLSMNLNNGLWYRFSSREGGSIYQFVSMAKGENIGNIYKLLHKDSLGKKHSKPISALGAGKGGDGWQNVGIVPSYAPKFNPARDIGFALQNYKLKAIYPYKDIDNRLLGYSIRLESKDSKKVIPISLHQKEGLFKWKMRGFNGAPMGKPIYGLEKCKNSNIPILVVEGEKTANAAGKIFPNHAVISWLGGTSNVDKVNWSILEGREVFIWPDNDIPGIRAGRYIQSKLVSINNKISKTYLINPKKLNVQDKIYRNIFPDKWDLADEFPEQVKLLDKSQILLSAKDNLEQISDSSFSSEREKRIYYMAKLHGINLDKAEVQNLSKMEDKISQTLFSKKIITYNKYLSKNGEEYYVHEFLDLNSRFYRELLIISGRNIHINGEEDQVLEKLQDEYQTQIKNFTDHQEYSKKYQSKIYGTNIESQEKRDFYQNIVRDMFFLYSKQLGFNMMDRVKEHIAKEIFNMMPREFFNCKRLYINEQVKIADKIFDGIYNSQFSKQLFCDIVGHKQQNEIARQNLEQDHKMPNKNIKGRELE